jgi:Ca-activated chloride channel family protein
MSDITFAYKPILFLLALIPALVAWYVWKQRDRYSDIKFVHSQYVAGVKKSFRLRLLHLPFVIRMLSMGLLIIALARPQTSSSTRNLNVEGVDIMVAIDISGSMLAEDFKPNRLEVAKETAIEFVDLRPTDRIGVSVFAGQSITLVPLTTDHMLVKDLTSKVNTRMVEDGTAIGDGLATSLNRLKESEAVSKVIILLTDGINNAGIIDPLTAAEIAKLYGIRVYTIGVGSKGSVPYPMRTQLGGVTYQMVELPVDEALLKQMAEMTGGRYFWTDSRTKLEEVYKEIDQLERTKFDVTEFSRKHDKFFVLVLLALAFLVVEIVLRNTWLRTNP